MRMDESTHTGHNLHQAGKNIYRTDYQPLPRDAWPDEWKTIDYKQYPRFTQLALPAPNQSSRLAQLCTARSSEQSFAGLGLTQESLGNALYAAGGQLTYPQQNTRRVYASAGARYPIELYVIVRTSRDPDLAPGVYHYQVQTHALEYLWPEKDQLPPLVTHDWADKAEAIVVMTAVFARCTNKYGARGYRFIYMDAGAMLQNLYLHAAETAGIAVTGYGGTNDDILETLLRLNPARESVVSAALIGSTS